jgi:hypothetical protein
MNSNARSSNDPMNSRLRFSLLATLASAALALASCGGEAPELQTADTAALVAAPAAQLLAADGAAEPAPARRAFTPVVAPGEGIELMEGTISEKSEKLKYKIDLTFPQLKGRLTPNAVKFNREMRALVAREAREFKRAYGGATDRPWAKEKFWEGVDDSLEGRYEFIHLDDSFAGVRLELFAYGRGAAHSVQFHRVLNFDLKSGRTLELADLFVPGARYLQALAAHSVAELRRQDEEAHRREVARVTSEGRPASGAGVRTPDSDFVSGAGPEADNYRAWNLAAEGVVVAFAACQVGGCADGEKEVLIPFSALEAVLDRSGPAARLFAPQAH